MPKFLRWSILLLLFAVASFITVTEGLAQGCSFPGSPPNGGPLKKSNGQTCANLQDPGVIDLFASNVNDGNNRNNFGVFIDWNDGTTEAIKWGDAGYTFNYDATTKEYSIIGIKHVFPVTGNQVKCVYEPRAYLSIAMDRNTHCPSPHGNPASFIRWNFDDQNTGRLELSESVTRQTVYEVCQGATTAVTFRDRSRLNCVPPSFNDVPNINNFRRWRRFTYGTANTITGTVTVGGTPVVAGTPLVAPVSTSNEPITAPFPPVGVNTAIITVPATAQAGEYFDIQMDYWNTCNPYPGEAPRQFTARILVVAQPPAPTPVNHEVCKGANLSSAPLSNNYTINFAGASDAVFWFQDNGSGTGPTGSALTNPNGTNSKNFPISSFPGGINPNTPGVYRLWASYRRPGAGSTPACESVVVPVTLTIRQDIPTPGPFTTATNEVCNGSTGVMYRFASAAGSLSPGGATQYEYEVTDISNAVQSDVTLSFQPDGRTWLADFNISNAAFGGAASLQRKIRIRRKYSTNVTSPTPVTTCPSNYYEYTITIYRQTDAGTITGGDTKCQGEPLTALGWTPGVGSIVRWERSDDNGATWNTQASFGTSTNPNPTTLNLGAGTYRFRAQIQNGVCAMIPTAQETYVINPNADIAVAGAPQQLCFAAAAILTTNMAGNLPTPPAVGSWDVVSGPAGGIANFATPGSNTSAVTVNNPGKYTFRWTIVNGAGTCATESTVEVSFGRDPGTPVPVSSTVCGLTSVLTTTTPPVFEEVTWTFVSGPVGGTAAIDDNKSYNTNVTVNKYGSYTFNVKYSSGSCPTTPNANVVMNFTEPVAVTPDAGFYVCEDETSVNVSGVISGGNGAGVQTGQWALTAQSSGTFSSGGTSSTGTVAAGTATFAGVYQPVAADVTRGFFILQLVGNDPDGALVGCPSAAATMRIDLDKKPANATAAPIAATCSDVVTLNATAPNNGGVGVWSINSTTTATLVDPNLRNTQVIDLQSGPTGTNVFRWTVSSAQGKCAPTFVDVDVIRDPAPVINALNPELCESVLTSGRADNIDLSSYETAITGGASVTLEWFTNSSMTPASKIDPTVLRNITSGTTFYLKATTTSGAMCTTDGVISYIVNPLPFVGNVLPEVCDEDAADGVLLINNIKLSPDYDALAAISMTDRAVTWFSDVGLTTPVIGTVNGVTDGQTFYGLVENTVTGCSNVAEVTYKINPIPVPNDIVGPNKVCVDPAGNNVIFYKVTNLLANYKYNWTVPGTVDLVTGITTDFFILATFPTGGSQTLQVVETSDKGCVGPINTFSVDVEANPGALTIAGPTDVCEGAINTQFTTDLFPNITYQWQVPAGATIVVGQNTDKITVNFGSTAGDVTVVPTTTLGCAGTGAVHPVAVNLKPELVEQSIEVCSKELTNLTLTATRATTTSYNLVTRINDAGIFAISAAAFPQNGITDSYVANDQFGNVTGGPLNVRYTVEPISDKGCVGSQGIVTVAINPEPQLDLDLGKKLCSGEETGITLRSAVGSVIASDFVFTAITIPADVTALDTPPTISTIPSTIVKYPASAIETHRWSYSGGTYGVVTYQVNPVSPKGCIGTPSSPLELNIFPIPQPVITADTEICSQESKQIEIAVPNITTATLSISAAVSAADVNIAGALSTVGTTNPFVLQPTLVNNSTSSPGNVEYTFIAENKVSVDKSCTSTPQILTIQVDPLPDANKPTLQGCAAIPNSGVYTATLADIEPLVSPGNTFTWYEQDPTGNPSATVIPGPTYDVQDGVPIFAEVANGYSCKVVVPITHTVNNAVSLALSKTDISCNGFQDGQILATASFGTAPFFFQKDTDPFVAAAGSTFNYVALPSGTYSVTVRDSKGCTKTLSSGLITEPTPLTYNSVTVKDVDCFFDATQVKDRNGEIKVVVSGSSGNYQYQLFPGPVTNTTGVFANLKPGSYGVIVSDVGNTACKLENSPVIVGLPDRVEITQVFIPTDSYGNQISCYGAENGSVQVTSRGGTGSYFVTLSPFNPPAPVNAVANTPVTFNGLAAGIYQIAVEDTKGCKAPLNTASISGVPELSPGLVGVDQDICFNQADAAGDADPFTALASPFGGSGPYEYVWQQSNQPLPTGTWTAIAGATSETYDPDPSGGGTNSPFTTPGAYYYRRLVRNTPPAVDLPNRPSFCNDYKGGDNVLTISVRETPAVSIIGAGVACPGDDKFYQLRLDAGTAPMSFSWNDGNFIYNNQTSNQTSPPYKVADIQQPVTVGFFNIKDVYGCIAPDAFIDIEVTQINADFNVDAIEHCSGDGFTFTHDVDNNLDYFWNFGDGSAELIRGAGTSTGTETYTYNPSITAQGDAKFFVTFKAQEAGGGCFKTATKELTVFRSLNLALSPPPTEICFGESFKLTDKSTGVTSGVYYYADVNGTNRGPDIAAPLTNVTVTLPDPPSNGFEYYIYYEAKNTNNCPAEQRVGPVKVYKTPAADFYFNPAKPKMIAGVVEVDFINTSTPLDNTDFKYVWDYPIVDVVSATDPNQFDKHVVFSSSTNKEVTLSVINVLRSDCRSNISKTLEVDLEDALAAFIATRAGCTPLHIDTKNLSVSYDKFEWTLSGPNGINEKSQLTEPQFDLNQPGTYYLTLTASKAGASIAPSTTEPKTIEVLVRPRADFFFRQSEVYVGSQVKPVNETVGGCDGCWNWDFGDGFTYQGVFEPVHNYSLEGKYTVSLETYIDHGNRDVDDDGILDGNIVCNDIAVADIRVIEGGKIKIPNAFTPNVNGPNGGTPDANFTNDVFLPIMDGVEEFTMQIFDRWGNLLFQSKEKNVGWDGYDQHGKLMPAGVYVYKVVLRLGDGERTTKVGDVTLIR